MAKTSVSARWRSDALSHQPVKRRRCGAAGALRVLYALAAMTTIECVAHRSLVVQARR